MEAKKKQAGWGFWLLWCLASTIGMLIGFVGGFFLALYTNEVIGGIVPISLLGISAGLSVGLMQWLVLRQHVAEIRWWILTYFPAICGLGLLVAAVGSGKLPGVFGGFLIVSGLVVCGGAVTGTLQWIILRKKVSKAGWWILACAAGWGLIMPIVKARPWGALESSSAETLFTFVAVAAMLGAVLGGVMTWLLRQCKNNEE